MTVCENCHNYKTFGNKCWYYWERKKSCSQFKRSAGDEPSVQDELIQIN